MSFYQPLETTQTFFVSPSVFAIQSLEYIYDHNDPAVQLDNRRLEARLDAGIALGTWGELRAGIQRGSIDILTKVGEPESFDPTGKYATGGLTARFVVDTQDRRVFPTAGIYMSLTGTLPRRASARRCSYQTASFDFTDTYTRNDRNTWTVLARGGSDFGSQPPFYDQFSQGGLFSFSGYQINELIGREYAMGALQFRHAVTLNGTSGDGHLPWRKP